MRKGRKGSASNLNGGLAWVRAGVALVLTEVLLCAYCEINLWALDYTDLTTLVAVRWRSATAAPQSTRLSKAAAEMFAMSSGPNE
jgi:hypothetical protein